MESFERKSSAFISQVRARVDACCDRIRFLLGKMCNCFRLANEDPREKHLQFVSLIDVMFSDIRKGALICIKGAMATVAAFVRTPLDRRDRKKLWELHKKWKTALGVQLSHSIEAESERSASSNDWISDQQAIANQCQVLIHAIWTVFGNGEAEPDVAGLTTFGVRFERIIQDVIAIQEIGLVKIRQQIREA
jgi:hypothetical protein